ncbi:32209_t:CDS:2, partial [Racocetra persica]
MEQHYLLAQRLEGNTSISQQTISYTGASISNIATYDTNSHAHMDKHNATAFSRYHIHQIYSRKLIKEASELGHYQAHIWVKTYNSSADFGASVVIKDKMIISQQTKELDNGLFIVQPANNKKYERYEMPDFNILPEKKQKINIEYRDRKFNFMYKLQENDNNNNQSYSQPQSYYYKEPDLVLSIFLSVINNDSSSNNKLDINAITEFISEIMSSYFRMKEKNYKHKLQEILLKKELDSFVNDKEFYKRIDFYYLNLKEIKNNNDMSAAFSSVLPNQIIVLEDVDTQSNILYKR